MNVKGVNYIQNSISNEVNFFFNLPNPSSCTMALELIQPLNRNEYQEFSLGLRCDRCIRLITTLPSVSQKYGFLNITQPCRPSWPVTGIVLLSYVIKKLIHCRCDSTLELIF
jgi:hypothetical protein